jgi:hypothetical protein
MYEIYESHASGAAHNVLFNVLIFWYVVADTLITEMITDAIMNLKDVS